MPGSVSQILRTSTRLLLFLGLGLTLLAALLVFSVEGWSTWVINKYAALNQIPLEVRKLSRISPTQIEFENLNFKDENLTIQNLSAQISLNPSWRFSADWLEAIRIRSGKVLINANEYQQPDETAATQTEDPSQPILQLLEELPHLSIDIDQLEMSVNQKEQAFDLALSGLLSSRPDRKFGFLKIRSPIGNKTLVFKVQPPGTLEFHGRLETADTQQWLELSRDWMPEETHAAMIELLSLTGPAHIQVKSLGSLAAMEQIDTAIDLSLETLAWENTEIKTQLNGLIAHADFTGTSLRSAKVKGAPWEGNYDAFAVSGKDWVMSLVHEESKFPQFDWRIPIEIKNETIGLEAQADSRGRGRLTSLNEPALEGIDAQIEILSARYAEYRLKPTLLKVNSDAKRTQLSADALSISIDEDPSQIKLFSTRLTYEPEAKDPSEVVRLKATIPPESFSTLIPDLMLPGVSASLKITDILQPEIPQTIALSLTPIGENPEITFQKPALNWTGTTETTLLIEAPEGLSGDWQIATEVQATGDLSGDYGVFEDLGVFAKMETSISGDQREGEYDIETLLSRTKAELILNAQDAILEGVRGAVPEIIINLENSALEINASSVYVTGDWPIDIEEFTVQGRLMIANLRKLRGNFQAEAYVDNNFVEFKIDLLADRSKDQSEITIATQLEPFSLNQSTLISELLPEYKATRISGNFQGASEIKLIGGVPDASLDFKFESLELIYPPAGIRGEGISGNLQMDSLRAFSGPPGKNTLTAQSISFGDIETTGWTFEWDWISGELARIQTASLQALGGRVTLLPSTLNMIPLSIQSELIVEDLDLYEIGGLIEGFNGSLAGRIGGRVPFTFRNGLFVPKEAVIGLPEGEIAKLYYTSRIFSEETASSGTMSDWVLRKLELEPNKILSDTLSDLTIDTFQMSLFSEKTPEIPMEINISGKGRSGDLEVPLILDIPVRGSLKAFYNFLIRLSMMSPSIE